MLNRILLGTVSVLAIGGTALAADVRIKTQPLVSVAPKAAYSWTGAYVGAHVSGGISSSTSRVTFPGYTNPGDLLDGLTSGLVTANIPTFLNDVNSLTGGMGEGAPFGSLLAPTFGPGQSNVLMSGTYLLGGAATLLAAPIFPDDLNIVSKTPVSFPNAPGKLGGADPVFGGGAEIGYNHQFGFAVFGAVADFTWLGKAKSSSWASSGNFAGIANEPSCEAPGGSGNGSSDLCTYSINGTATSTGSVQASAQWLSTLRLKAGVAMDRMMVYGTGGLAFGKVNMNSRSSWTDSVTATCTGTGNNFEGGGCEIPGVIGFGSSANWQGSSSKTMTGYAVGGGLEYAVTDNWLLKAEGLYYNLGTARMDVNGTGSAYAAVPGGFMGVPNGQSPEEAVTPYKVEKEIRGVVGKVGVSYKFATR